MQRTWLEVLAPAMLQCYLSVVGARNAAAAEPVMNAGDDGLSRLDGASAYCSLLLPRCLSVCLRDRIFAPLRTPTPENNRRGHMPVTRVGFNSYRVGD